MRTKRIFYRVITPSTYSNLDASTLKLAKLKKQEFGDCPNGTEENKAYWKLQRKLCKIVRVVETTEEVE